jgi:hypothetical protein
MKKYYFEDVNNEDELIEVPSHIIKEITRDYIQGTYYWSVGLLCIIIGFLLGVMA